MIWSTDLTETLELENLIDQAAQETFSAEARKESHEARAHVDFPERDDENWAKHALSWLHKPCVENAEVPGSTVGRRARCRWMSLRNQLHWRRQCTATWGALQPAGRHRPCAMLKTRALRDWRQLVRMTAHWSMTIIFLEPTLCLTLWTLAARPLTLLLGG